MKSPATMWVSGVNIKLPFSFWKCSDNWFLPHRLVIVLPPQAPPRLRCITLLKASLSEIIRHLFIAHLSSPLVAFRWMCWLCILEQSHERCPVHVRKLFVEGNLRTTCRAALHKLEFSYPFWDVPLPKKRSMKSFRRVSRSYKNIEWQHSIKLEICIFLPHASRIWLFNARLFQARLNMRWSDMICFAAYRFHSWRHDSRARMCLFGVPELLV